MTDRLEDSGSTGSDTTPAQHPAAAAPALASDPLIILPVRSMVLFPGMVVPVTVGRKGSMAAVQHAVRAGRPVGILMQRDDQTADPVAADLHTMGTTANILRFVTTPDGLHHLVCQGLKRFQVIAFEDNERSEERR